MKKILKSINPLKQLKKFFTQKIPYMNNLELESKIKSVINRKKRIKRNIKK